jgi:hypothetical protein
MSNTRLISSSLWKPLNGPLQDWPLGLVDASTLDATNDLVPADFVTREGYSDNSRVYFNPRHEWYYLSQQLASEVILFRQFDTNSQFKRK